MSERGGEAAPSRDPADPATADGPCRRMEQAARGLAAADRWCREAGEDALQAALEAYRAAFARYSAAYEACREERRRRAFGPPAPIDDRPVSPRDRSSREPGLPYPPASPPPPSQRHGPRPRGVPPAGPAISSPFVPDTAERLDDVGTRRAVELVGYGRIAFHISRVRRASRCAVTGAAIPKGALALLPDDPDAIRVDEAAGPFRVSLEGWGRLEGGRGRLEGGR
ncbi:MAG TPA: hypothetical protein VK002_11795 [Rubricoccaceae bacterium]|nr:hypothetical protein [Rubricoccaceae bacterium]